MPITVTANNNESPDSTQAFTSAVTGNGNTGHSNTTSSVTIGSEDSNSQTKTCRWFNFVGPPVKEIKLKFNWSINGELVLTGAAPDSTVANAAFSVSYSIDGGSNWTTAVIRSFQRNVSGSTPFSDSGSETITLPLVALGQIQVRDRIRADAFSTLDPTVSASSTITASIDSIQLEVEPQQLFAPIVIM